MKILGVLGLSIAMLLAAPACDKDTKGNAPGVASAAENKKKASKLATPALFKKIPADAVFVFANYERLDDKFIDAVAGYLGPLMEMSKAKIADESPEAAQFMKEHADLFSRAGLKKIGITTQPFFAMYNHDLSIVIRVELEDGQALLGFIDKLIAKYGEGDASLASKTVGSMRYWESSPDDGQFIIGIDKKEIVVALMPKTSEKELKPYILGQKEPAKNITEGGSLLKVVAENGGAKGVGFFDAKAGMKLLFSGKEGLAGSDLDLSGMSKICKDEVGQLVSVMPRIIFGYDRLDTSEMSMFYGVELRDDVAKRLSKVVRPVPGYDYATKAKASVVMGMGFNVGEAMAWGVDISKKLKQNPFQCDELRDLNEVLAELEKKTAIAEPLVGDISGVVAMLDNIDVSNPLNISGLFAIQSSDVGALVGVAKNFIPGASKLKLEVGGAPVKIDESITKIPVNVSAARGENMIGLAVGATKMDLKALVSSKDATEGPFMVMSNDYQALASLMEEEGGTNPESKMAQEMLAKLGDMIFEMRATESGLVLRSAVTLK